MNEWILIITLSIVTEKGNIRDISQSILPEFTSEKNCRIAANQIGINLVKQSGYIRNSQGIKKGSRASEPMIYSDCLLIKK